MKWSLRTKMKEETEEELKTKEWLQGTRSWRDRRVGTALPSQKLKDIPVEESRALDVHLSTIAFVTVLNRIYSFWDFLIQVIPKLPL